ncbi:hypothetical protein [Pedobacter sp. Hv1]|uniref:hypothetical protein n=1 Tax=Pedobacter sp. Hv1 TaxID=1740090 RepID=UPI0006D8A911|nr:hypothetical protein [Pedobacter sp. Hv1]KQC01673.1 hypothetical protein AQF98_04685 [Pedobacter sp. Hv1]
MKKTINFILLLMVLQATTAFAQVADSIKTKNRQMSIQVLAGSQGIGANFRYVLNKNIALRFGGSYAQAGINDKLAVGAFNSKNRLSGKLGTIHALAELMPQKFIRVVAGAAYLPNARMAVYFEPKDAYSFEGITLTPQEIGSLEFQMNWATVAPYLGVGIGRGIPKNRFNVNVDLGAYYISTPKVTAIGTKLLTNNDSNAIIIQNNMKSYRFLPVAQLNFNFKF